MFPTTVQLNTLMLHMLTMICQVAASLAQTCPAGYECNQFGMSTSLSTGTKQQCPQGYYSLHGWGRCCALSSALACGEQFPGHFALNSDCQCATLACPSSSFEEGTNKEIMRGEEGQLICNTPPPACKSNAPCPSGSMMREVHTCNCLRIVSPCMKNEVLWGNAGGPFVCIPLTFIKR